MWITLWYALLPCSCAGFYFVCLYWPTLLPEPWQFLSWCSGWRVSISANVTQIPWTGSVGRRASGPLTLDPSADCFLSPLFSWGPCSWPLKLLRLLWPSPPLVWAQVLLRPPSQVLGTPECHEVRGCTRYRLSRGRGLLGEQRCTCYHAAYPLCSQAWSAVPSDFTDKDNIRDKRTTNLKTVTSGRHTKTRHFSAQGPMRLSRTRMKPVLDDMLRNVFFLLTEHGKHRKYEAEAMVWRPTSICRVNK